jgi:hypothetical protein
MKSTPDDPTQFDVGQHVLVSYPNRPPNKLAPKWRGPLVVVEVKGNTYVCQDLCTHKVVSFHISRLKAYNMDSTPDVTAVAAVDQDEWEVEEIVDHRGPKHGRPKSKLEFRVRWKGFEPEEDTWLPYAEVRELQALDAYTANHPELRL